MSDTPNQNPLDLLVDEYVQSHRSGTPISIDDFAARHPTYANDIRELFPLVVNIEQLKASSNSQPTALMVPAVERIGDFKIIREVGRGGMGIVFEAVQESLGRRVALKVMSDSGAPSSNQVARFRREAESASRLHHTHIVPVYGIGHDGPWHYIAMQFIDGVSLDRVAKKLRERIESLSTAKERAEDQNDRSVPTASEPGELVETIVDGWLGANARSLATGAYRNKSTGLIADVADALEHAHQQGVLHRDVKPGNLLVDKHMQVWITDFGLAKPDTHEALTKSGDVMGTFRYMAPEQFRGQSDARSDIYSLGLTLFELLTLRPAFDETRNGLLANPLAARSIPRLRRVDQSFPRDLDTIVAKATDSDPKHRYASAGDLASDLRAYLDGRAIRARRASSLEHAWRWCRRNPAPAVSALLVAASLITATGVSLWSGRQTKLALDQVSEANQQAQESRLRAEDNLNLAIDGFDRILENVSNRGNPQTLPLSLSDDESSRLVVEIHQEDIVLLNQLLSFYGQFTQRNQSDPFVAFRNAAAYHRIGKIEQRLKRFNEATESFEQAMRIYDNQLEREPDDIECVVAKAELMNDMGLAMTERLKPLGDVVAQHQAAIEFLSSRPSSVASDAEVGFQLARAYDLAGSARFRDRVASSGVRTVGAQPARPGLGDGSEARAAKGYSSNPRQFHRDSLQQARQTIERLAREHPEVARYKLLQAQTERHWLAFIQIDSEASDATDVFHTARRTLEDLVSEYPTEPVYLSELAETLSMVNMRRTKIGEQEAIEYLRKAVDCSQTLCKQYPNVLSYVALAVNNHSKLARYLRGRGSLEEAQHHLEEAWKLLSQLCRDRPSQSTYRTTLLASTLELSDVFRQRAEETSDLQYVKNARQMVETTLREYVDGQELAPDRTTRQTVVALYHSLARSLRKLGEERASSAANATAKRLAAELPTTETIVPP